MAYVNPNIYCNTNIYSACSTIAVNCTVYTNPERTVLAPSGYYSVNGVTYLQVSNGVVTSINNSCATIYTLNFSASDPAIACSSGVSRTIYSYCMTLSVGCAVYSDNSFINSASVGYYSDGSQYYTVSYVQVYPEYFEAQVTAITTCPATCPPAGLYAYTQFGIDYCHDGLCGYYQCGGPQE